MPDFNNAPLQPETIARLALDAQLARQAMASRPTAPPDWVARQHRLSPGWTREPEPPQQEEPAAVEPDVDEDEPESEPPPKAESEAPPQPDSGDPQGAVAGGDDHGDEAPRRERYVKTEAIKAAVKCREAEVLRALGIGWPAARGDHIHCPLPGHDDHDPSWRWAEDKSCWFCTCGSGSIFDVVMRIEGVDFEAAKMRVAEILNLQHLIVQPDASSGVTLQEIADAKKLPIEFLRKMGWFELGRRGQNHDRSAIGIRYSDGTREWLRIRIALGGDTKRKFRWRKGDREAPLYRAHQVGDMRNAGYVFLVGGESCSVTLLFHDYPALGLPGEGCWNEARHAPLLDGFPKIYVVVEPDKGGQSVLSWVARSSIRSRVMFLFMTPAAKDMSALYLADPAGFEAAVRALMATAVPFEEEKHAPPRTEPAKDETRSRRTRDEDQAEGGPVSPRGLPVITYAGGRLAAATDRAEELLAEGDPLIFQRSDFLVRFGMAEDMQGADGEKIKGPRLIRVEVMHLQDRMNRVIEFMKFDAKLDDYKPINPPRDVAEALRQRKGLWKHIQVIDGIASAPTWRTDGTILDQPGFDPLTRVLYIPTPGVTYLPIPQNPAKDDARQALDTLCELISEFAFVQENGDPAIGQPSPSRSVALSGLITPMVRRAILTAPFHAFDATDAGSGKSKLCSLASIIARGHVAPVISGGSALNPEEFEKRISTALIAADAIVVIDNIEGQFGSELLCSATTEQMLNIRVLGLSKNVRVPNNATFFGNGNGLTIVGDLPRRSLRCRLDPKTDRPELRTFDKPDPVLRAMRDRPVYVAAILTILRAFHVAGRPKQQHDPFGSFEDWSALVRDALMWLDQPDPCITMQAIRLQDPKRRNLAAVLHEWCAVLGDGDVTAARVVEIAEQRDGADLLYPDFREALYVVAGERGAINSVKLGNWLRSRRGKTIDRLRFEQAEGGHGGVTRWKVVQI